MLLVVVADVDVVVDVVAVVIDELDAGVSVELVVAVELDVVLSVMVKEDVVVAVVIVMVVASFGKQYAFRSYTRQYWLATRWCVLLRVDSSQRLDEGLCMKDGHCTPAWRHARAHSEALVSFNCWPIPCCLNFDQSNVRPGNQAPK